MKHYGIWRNLIYLNIINEDNYNEKWPTTVIKLSGKMQGEAVLMLKAKNENEAMRYLNINDVYQAPKIFKSGLVDKLVDKLFGQDKTVIYQDFVPPALRDEKAGRIRLNVIINPLTTFALSDYYMWTVFNAPDKCPDGLIPQLGPYIVNWKFSGKRAQFVELSETEREAIKEVEPQICSLLQQGIEAKFISDGS